MRDERWDDAPPPSQRNWLLYGVLGFLLLFAALLLFRAWNRSEELDRQLADAAQQEASLEKQVADETLSAAGTRERAELAEANATAAQKEALRAAQERGQAEWERELARVEAEQAQRRSQQAEAIAAESTKEYDELKQARQRELDRMQRALSAIVETERTPLGMVMRLGEDSLQFNFDKDTIREQDKELLSRIAGVLLASHGYRLAIYGYTDDQGPASYNKNLSERRADAVRKYFIDAGVPADIMTSQGLGESNPRVKGTSEAARQKNRRVEIGLVDTVITYDADEGTAER
ncbi:MAG: OmpA family protein [Acidobacteria bacterium]|nr:OmpA family protein [Acidobacteriota bacterium]